MRIYAMRQDLRATFTDRQYMLSEDYELFYYSDTHFTPTKLHHHSYYECYFFIKGDIDYYIDGISHSLLPNDIVIIPPGINHYAVSNDPDKVYQRIVFWISKNYYEYFRSMSEDVSYLFNLAKQEKIYVHHCDSITFNSLESRFFDLIQETKLEHYGKSFKISLLIAYLLLSMNRYVYEQNHPLEHATDDSLYSKLITYIEANVSEPITLDSLSKQFFVSKSYISHTFKQNQGISLHQFIQKRRLQIIKDSIAENSDIQASCLSCGFNDYSSFYRAFKREYGLSPKEYRDQITRAKNEHMKSQQ